MRLIGLEHVAATESTQNTKDREQHRKDFTTGQTQFVATLGDVVHRTTGNRAVFVFVAILHAERTFGEPSREDPRGSSRT